MTSEAYEQYRAYTNLCSKLEKIQELVTQLPTQVGVSKYDYGQHIAGPIRDELLKAIQKSYNAINTAQEKL